jgi:hypothetical protein
MNNSVDTKYTKLLTEALTDNPTLGADVVKCLIADGILSEDVILDVLLPRHSHIHDAIAPLNTAIGDIWKDSNGSKYIIIELDTNLVTMANLRYGTIYTKVNVGNAQNIKRHEFQELVSQIPIPTMFDWELQSPRIL